VQHSPHIVEKLGVDGGELNRLVGSIPSRRTITVKISRKPF
jgi:hypothetical protein